MFERLQCTGTFRVAHGHPGNMRWVKGKNVMTNRNKRSVILSLTLFVSFALVAPARASELDELKATVQSMQKSMEQMQQKIAELERENHKQKQQAAASRTAPAATVEAAAPAPGSTQTVTIATTAVTIEGR